MIFGEHEAAYEPSVGIPALTMYVLERFQLSGVVGLMFGSDYLEY